MTVMGQCPHCGWQDNALLRAEEAGLIPPLDWLSEEMSVKPEDMEQPHDRVVTSEDRPPALKFEDRKRVSPTRPSGRAEPSAPEPQPTTPKVTPPPERESKASDRIPSLDQLVEVHQALWGFCDLMHSSAIPAFEQERVVLPRFVRLADALCPVRSVIAHIDGWPTKIGRALRSMIKAFDATASQWGWERVVPPDPMRSEFLEERRVWVRENLERPVFEAALAASTGWDESKPCPYDDLADEARRRGFVTTLTSEEGIARFEPARSRLNRELHIGKTYPKIGEHEAAEFIRTFNDLHGYVVGIAPDQCTRPPWQEHLAVRPGAVPSPNNAPTPEQTHSSVATTHSLPPREDDKTLGGIPSETVSPAPPSPTTSCSSQAQDDERQNMVRRRHRRRRRRRRAQAQNDERQNMVRDQVFISYSHKDQRFLNDLLTHLKPYLRKGTFTAWSDQQIKPGSQWFDEIKAELAKTSVAVMLVSPDFLASDFIHEHELGPLLKEAAAGGVTILWVLIRDCSYEETLLEPYQAVLSPDKSLASMTKAKRDTAWKAVCKAIQQAVNRPLASSSDSAGTAPVSQRETVPVGPESRDPSTSTASYSPTTAQTTNGTSIVPPLKIICPLHGIRTLAVWQKGLSDLAGSRGWVCRLERWSFGRLSLPAFLTPWTREAKLKWLRRQYDAEINDRRLDIEQGQTPSVVAHSFGTYILGYTLIRFDFIRFNKVILCGSILPRDFPWDKLIERGQIQAIRNEYGVRDPWVKRVRWFVRGTGPSGASGFTCKHDRLEQEEFEYDHGDYFGTDHMDDRWMPFLNRPLGEIPRSKDGPRIPRPPTTSPWGLYGLVVTAIVMVAVLVGWLINRRDSLNRVMNGDNNIILYIIGMKTDEAKNFLESKGMELRVIAEDGARLPVTQDYRKMRVNVETRNGRVELIKGSY
jgi:TIR domain